MLGTIYCPLPSQSIFLKVLNNNMNKIDLLNNKIYILGDFNINLYLNDSYFLEKNSILSTKLIPSNVNSDHEFCMSFRLKQLMRVPTRITSSSLTIIDHILASYPKESLSVDLYILLCRIISFFTVLGKSFKLRENLKYK